MGIMDVKINTITQKDIADMNDPQVSNQIRVVNVSDREYAGIAPGQEGTVDISKWGPYQFALKKIRNSSEKQQQEAPQPKEEKAKVEEPKEEPEEEPKAVVVPKKYKRAAKLVLLKAFVHAANGNSRASLLLGVKRPTLIRWLNGKRMPSNKKSTTPITFDNLMGYLDSDEKTLFKEKVIELCQQKYKNEK